MLNSGKKCRALRDKKNKYSNSRIVRKKISEQKKNHNPSLPVKWSVPYLFSAAGFFFLFSFNGCSLELK